MNRSHHRRRKSGSHSIMVADRKRAITALVAGLAAQGDTVATGLEQRLATVLGEGEAMPDVRLLLRLLERLARQAERDLDEADAKRWLAGMGHAALRHACKQPKVELYAAAVAVRKTLVSLYGSGHCRFQFGLGERTPRGTVELTLWSRRLVNRLVDPGLQLPEPRLPGVALDPAGWAETLRPALEILEPLLAEVERRRVTAGDEVVSRRQALAVCDGTALEVARTAEALFTLSGHRELARRLRPTGRRRLPDAVAAKPVVPAVRLRARLRSVAAAISGWLETSVGRWRSRLLAGGQRRRAIPWRETALRRLAGRSSTARKG